MKNSIIYQISLLILLTVLLVFGVQSIGFSQLPVSPDKIKDESTHYVVWIVTEKGSGSGVLISKDYRLVVTNAHVTGDYKEVEVFFAVRDSSGKIVRARPFYRNKDHQNTLQRLGYVTRGRVIAKYQHPGNEPDLAMIELDGLPGTAIPRKLPSFIDYSKMKEGEHVHILGHPGERPLWHWKAGLFKEYNDKDLLLSADAYYGNSGGPVLNMDGKLIGISRAINADRAITFVVPTSAIIDLYKTLERVEIFSIYNNTELPIKYKIKWNEDEDWKEEEPIEPKKEQLHSSLAKDISTEYPNIRFEDSQNSKEASESVQKLETKSRFFGIGIKDVEDFDSNIESNDALRYQFMSDPETKKISLVKLKLVQTFMIRNNTKSPLFFQYRWHEDEKWQEEYIKPSEAWRYGKLSERVSPGYPKIRFNEIPGDRNDPEKSSSLLTEIGYFDKATKIKEDIKQMGWNPPLYYQFKNNVGTNGISLEELKRTQRFKIQNPTEVHIFFTYRWHENDKWEFGYIDPNETKVYKQQPEIAPPDSPKISYVENVSYVSVDPPKISYVNLTGDNKSTENIQKLETEIGYYNKNDEFTPDQNQAQPLGYYFKYNSKTQKLSLDEGLLTFSKKTDGWFFPLDSIINTVFGVLFAVLIIVVFEIIRQFIFPKRHIFSLQNNTESTVNYRIKWAKKDDWEQDTLDPDESCEHWWTGFFKKKPQIRFEQIVNDKDQIINDKGQIVNDKKKTEDVLKVEQTDKEVIVGTVKEMQVELKTKIRRIRQNAIDKISREDARQYHFGYDPETNELNLYDSEKKSLMF